MTPYAFEECVPTGTRVAVTLHKDYTVNVYSDHDVAAGRRFAALRRDLGLTLGEASRVMSVRVVDVSSLEHGRLRLVDERAAFAALRDYVSRRVEA